MSAATPEGIGIWPLKMLSLILGVRKSGSADEDVKDEEFHLGGDGPHVFAYNRISGYNQTDGVSTAVQRQDLRGMLDKMDPKPSHVSFLGDKAKSGYDSGRRIFSRVIEEMKSGCGKKHEIAVRSVDRLSRDSLFLLGFYVYFIVNEGKIRTTTGDVYSKEDPWSLVKFCFEALGADIPTKDRIKHSKESKLRNFEDGTYNVRPMYGYELAEDGWLRKVRDLKVQESIPFIFETYRRLKSITELNEEHFRKYGFRLQESRLIRMLKCSTYTGGVDPYKTGKPRIDSSLRYVPDELFDEVQRILEVGERKHKSKADDTFLRIISETMDGPKSLREDLLPWITHHIRNHGGPITTYGGGSESGPPAMKFKCIGIDPLKGGVCGVQFRYPHRGKKSEGEPIEWKDSTNLSREHKVGSREGSVKTRRKGGGTSDLRQWFE
jgi:hypothetical protein